MICQECQERQATVHVTKIINNKKKEIYLCEKCAQEKGELNFGGESFSFNNLLSGLLNHDFSTKSAKSKIDLGYQGQSECASCDLSYSEFSKSGKLGCSDCYLNFEERTDKLLKRIHGSNRHTGKVPRRTGEVIRMKKEIQGLRDEMQEAVEKEEFEEAAKLRDKIKELEAEIE
ncbi:MULTISPECIES: UvrB/UvrC motif-containing protein [unclassified Candidatus Frackibacter]|uniref:UvrB/UvrC motif-containing protein n=1 Tax=unclassified Candidatus Frackibacter TaxID=2648818 RepID=UPI000794681D|nr:MULTISPECIES: UvrB/UvrC motif-containing protein [unclassified Candidatus Frackibacter]KXS40449.1 MAG: UvrB/UvrC protein [Candidatus Frackibacter sp. T328-2]SDC21083.1 Protein-arginine kinase activator protein McsA [Candidatus Frackibacter sp. WG11]SEM50717.1 Protein-arginine kinase activator protein McsA [Candidatus Frackibacter sp. WG12]SFL52068.1 Protein-arginine kinase activator protein McsA [Candidatus Frackibacter sp. WG13]